MIKKNIFYFNISKNNNEKLFDTNYMVLKEHINLDDMINDIKEFKDLLTTIKTLRKNNDSNIEIYYKKACDIFNQKDISKSEFNSFKNACNLTNLNNIYIFKKIVNLYLDNRNISEYTPREWVQALIDRGASRSKGTNGENKLINLSVKRGFKEIDNWNDFVNNNKVIVKFSKNLFDIPNINKKLNLNLNFDNQNKMLDIIIKNQNKIIFIEAKHIKDSGGSQDKQIHELINIVEKNPNQKNIYIGAFLDGVKSNELLNADMNGNNKVNKQLKDILNALKKNKNSFWFNTKGFIQLLNDFT